MDVKTLRGKSVDALTRELAEAESEKREYRFQLASHQLKQVRSVRDLRKTIARIQMVLREKK